ncbi:hypothetical protein FA15DRAFT_605591, partial [Coprinopsis marcescibilis]
TLQGLFISGDITHSSTSAAAAGSYHSLTKEVAVILGIMFKHAFPHWYERYRLAFDAGVWLPEDPGPFLGRAVIFKLQGRLHKDRQDLGPSVCFGVGRYSGAEMLFPQFGAKLAYLPGEVCIFYSSDLYHMVAPYQALQPSEEDKRDQISPGRIGSVFFFPKESFKELYDKPEGWGYKTQWGKNSHLFAV